MLSFILMLNFHWTTLFSAFLKFYLVGFFFSRYPCVYVCVVSNIVAVSQLFFHCMKKESLSAVIHLRNLNLS